MKRYYVLIIFCLLTSALFAEEIVLGTFGSKKYNDVWKQFFSSGMLVRYDIEKSEVLIYSDDTLCIPVMILDEVNLMILKEILTKYFEWNKKASTKAVKIEKEIDRFSCKYFFKYGDDWYRAVDNVVVVFSFFSRTIDTHELVIENSKLTSTANEFIDCTVDGEYLTYSNVKELQKCLSEDNIKLKISEYKKKQLIESEFD